MGYGVLPMIGRSWGVTMHERRELPDIVFGISVMIILVELTLLSAGLDVVPIGVELAIFGAP
jgi:hypothetical protein